LKTVILFITLVFLASEISYSQLGNQNMTLLANRNQHGGSGNQYSAIWGYRAPNGREYAILGCQTGTAFIDVTDSSNIVEVAYKTGVSSGWREMKVFSHYAYVVSEGTNSRLQIFDLQYLPDSVRLVNTYSYTNYTKTHTISQSGPYLYLNGGNVTQGMSNSGGVTVLDLTNPVLPVKRGSWGEQYVHDCRIVNDTIYACNIYDAPQGTGSIYVISATNKDNLTNVSSWVNNPVPGPHNIALTGDRRYALTTDEIPNTSPRVLKVWDIQNLSNVTLVTTWQPTNILTSIVHNVEIYGNYALIAHYRAGVRLVDISNPAVPNEIAWYDTYPSSNSNSYSGCWGVFMLPSGKIIASDMQTGLYVLKATVPLVGINEPGNNVPASFTLKQNYPNPFNPSTSIEYSLPKGSHVTLRVFDAVGREVGILVDEYKSAGSYKVSYDAGRLSSGVYFYSLSSNGFKETKKMTLVK
jgi:choice-of-anchor B domain-containing protein